MKWMSAIGGGLVATSIVLSLVGCGTPEPAPEDVETETVVKQTAQAYLDQDGTTISATVDLSDGWSVEFARGAIYLYDGEITNDTEAVAIGVTLSRDVYQEDLAEAIAAKDHKETDGGIYYSRGNNETCFLCSVKDESYFLLSTESDDINIEKIRSRISLELDR